MVDFQKIKIENVEYFIVDSIQDLRAEDSFIQPRNKLEIYGGSGEARKYVGSYNGASGERLSGFFEFNRWGQGLNADGTRDYLPIQNGTCIFSKSNLLKYLADAKVEYETQEQVYRNDISEYYQENLNSVNELKQEINHFSIHDVSDLLTNPLNRGYIRSHDPIWGLWRKLILPKISYLSILKLVPVIESTAPAAPIFYFRVLLDYQFRSIVHPSLAPELLVVEAVGTDQQEEVLRIKAYRKGQDKYRKDVLNHMPQCPFTQISEDRMLIASHIKPYSACMKENREDQAIDHLNGLSLTPTYDRLFDQGYITFMDDGALICGTMLGAITWEKLNIDPKVKKVMRIYPENRGDYLEYHRLNVFLDNIKDLV